MVRAANYEEAVAVIAEHPLGNGAVIFTARIEGLGSITNKIIDSAYRK